MALSGIEIYKYLPRTNCKECGFPTCLAFAMKLSQKAVELTLCTYVSDEAKQALDAASRPPIRLITVGAGDRKIEAGNEVAMFRHEKTFYHAPGLVLRVRDTEPAEAIAQMVDASSKWNVERVGIILHTDGYAIENASGDPAAFANTAAAINAKAGLPLVLMSKNPAAMAAALEKVGGSKPLIHAATKDNADEMVALAQKHGCPLAVQSSDGLDDLAALSERVTAGGFQDVVLDPGARGFRDSLATLTQLRRLAIKKNFRPFGYPVITFPGEGASSPAEEAALASQQIAKYAGIVVLNQFDPAVLYPLLTLRLNIYTDPQKPIQVTPGLYQVGTPKESSPLCITTNFSLTYFSIAGELESSGWPSWLLVADTEGQSVLTSWAAGKFDADKIAKTVKAHNPQEKINHKTLILPGHVAVLRGELEEELPDWKIMVGPREAVDVGGYLKKFWAA